jgi:hypothetical protein
MNNEGQQEEKDSEEEAELLFDELKSRYQAEFLRGVISELLRKPFPNVVRKRLQIAMVNLAYHPALPDDQFILSVSFKSGSLYYDIAYGPDLISMNRYYTDEGSIFYEYEFTLYSNGTKVEHGDFDIYHGDVLDILNYLDAEKIFIGNEY